MHRVLAMVLKWNWPGQNEMLSVCRCLLHVPCHRTNKPMKIHLPRLELHSEMYWAHIRIQYTLRLNGYRRLYRKLNMDARDARHSVVRRSMLQHHLWIRWSAGDSIRHQKIIKNANSRWCGYDFWAFNLSTCVCVVSTCRQSHMALSILLYFFRPANSSKHRHFAFISHLRAYDPWSAHLMPINNRLLIEIYSELILIGSEKLFAAERVNEQANKWISHWHSWSLAHRPKIKITKNDERKFVSCYTGFAEFLTTKVTTQDERFQNPLCILPIDLYEQFSIFATLHWAQLAELWLNSMRVEQMEKRKNTKRTAKNI